MSWSELFEDISLEELADANPRQEHTSAHEPSREQFNIVKLAAEAIIASGVVGDPKKFRFGVSASGHGNVGHEPDPEWADDFISLRIYQKRVQADGA